MGTRNIITITAEDIIVQPRGLDILWCFRRQVPFPLSSVSAVEVVPKHTVKRGIRTLGADFGFKICGTFQSEGVVNFWNYRGPEDLLAIQLSPAHRFTNLYLSVANAEEWRGKIEDACAV